MKPLFLTATLALALPAVATAQDAKPVPTVKQAPADAQEKDKEPKVYEVGTKVPEKVTLIDMDGKKTTMKQLRGKHVVLVWYSKDCPAIKSSGERLAATAKEFAKHKDVVMIAVNSDKNDLKDAQATKDAEGNVIKPFAKLRKHMKDKKINFGMAVDKGGVLARKFQAKTTPHVFVIDGAGVLRYQGAFDDREADGVNYPLNAVKAIKTGSTVEPTYVRQWGCGVKTG